MCATATLNKTISGEGLGRYKWYQSLISNHKCANKDVGPSRRVDCDVPHHLERWRLKSIYIIRF